MNSLALQMPNMLLEKSGEIIPGDGKDGAKEKHHPVVGVTGDGSKSDAVKNNIAQEPGMLDP